jgi:demethylmenaquinone methyltransferase/2-methoxy-6-polyprenyl-1,4-benzoquinol methylase
VLSDGSRHQVYKRYLTGTELAEEINGEVLMDGTWFVVARVTWADHLASAGEQE